MYRQVMTLGRQWCTRLHNLQGSPSIAVCGGLGSYRSMSETTGAVSGEAQLTSVLQTHFPGATEIQVQDISGGCGAMYEVWVEDGSFKGLSTVKQHRLITKALKAEIQDMHGLRITTSVPDNS